MGKVRGWPVRLPVTVSSSIGPNTMPSRWRPVMSLLILLVNRRYRRAFFTSYVMTSGNQGAVSTRLVHEDERLRVGVDVAEPAAEEEPHVLGVAVEEALVRVAGEPGDDVHVDDLVLEGRPLVVGRLDRLLEVLGRVDVRRFGRVAAFGVPEVGGAGGDAVEVRGRVEVDQREALLVGGPDELPGRRVAPDTDPVRGLQEDVGPFADAGDDVAEDGDVPGVGTLLVAGVDVDDGGAGFAAQPRVLRDLLGTDGHEGAVAALLHPAVDRGDDHERLPGAGRHGSSGGSWGSAER